MWSLCNKQKGEPEKSEVVFCCQSGFIDHVVANNYSQV